MLTHGTSVGYPQPDCSQIADTRTRATLPASNQSPDRKSVRPSGEKQRMQSSCGYLSAVHRQMLVGMNAATADDGARLLADGNQVPVLGLSEWW